MLPILSSRGIQVVLLLLGLVTLAGLIIHIGPGRIYRAGTSLGAVGVAVMLVPSTVMYLLDCLGWRFTLGRHKAAVPFPRLFVVRTAGELVNATTPTAYVGGEPLKASLLKTFSVPMADGLASVIVAKTTMTIAQIVYILLGIALGVRILLPSASTQVGHVSGMAAAVSLGLLVFATAMFIVIQRRGLFTSLFSLLGRCGIRVAPLEARREKLLALDKSIVGCYTHDRASFLFSTGAFFGGWFVEALEVYVILRYLGEPIDIVTALSIDALATFIKGGTFFIPGSIGAQEAGTLMLLTAYGYSDVTGMTFALLRRMRELIWIGVGVLCLAFLMHAERLSERRNRS
jgi:glycosyltransferase 2 family protein